MPQENPNETNKEATKALWDAMGKRDLNGVRNALANGADVDSKDRDGYTPLMYAVYMREGEELVKILLEYKPDMTVRNRQGDTPFLTAARYDRLGVAKLLLEHGAKINETDKNGNTPLALTVGFLKPDSAKFLIESGADLNAKDANGYTPLMLAADKDKLTVVRSLLEHGAEVDARNGYGNTALMVAAWHNHSEIVSLLIEHGADVNARSRPVEYSSPLLHAAAGFSSDSIKILVAHGADVNAKSRGDETPLILCARIRDLGVVQLLVDKGAEVNAKNGNGATALMEAVKYSDLKVAKFLLEHGADVNAKNKDGKTALSFAKDNNNTDMVELLLAHGAKEEKAPEKTPEKIVEKKTPKKAQRDKELSLETVLMNCRNALRGVGTTDRNRNAVISLVFLKFAGKKFEKQHEKLAERYGNNPLFVERPEAYHKDNVFYLPETARWGYIVKNASADKIATIIDDALAETEVRNPALQGALSLGIFSSLGAEKTRIRDLINNVNQIDEERFKEDDLIGHVYEYFFRVYAVAGSKEEGEFYTPASVVRLIAELIKPYSGTVYDPCCGSGGMFVQSLKYVERHDGNRQGLFMRGQEKQQETWRLCKMNLAIQGIAHNLGEAAASTFTEDMHRNLKADFIMANPPFNLRAWRDEDQLTDDPRFSGFSVMPPVSNANYAWILHIISKLRPDRGIAGFLLANGALNAGKSNDEDEKDESEYMLRKEIIERDLVEAIIVLPRDMFYTTDISATLWIINMNKKSGRVGGRQLRDRQKEILFVDLRRWDEETEEIKIDQKSRKKKTIFIPEQIAKVEKIYEGWKSADRSLYQDMPELCRSAKIDEIREKDYSLAPSKYIEFIDHDLEIDYAKEMKRIQSEMREIVEQETQTQNMLKQAFKGIGYGID